MGREATGIAQLSNPIEQFQLGRRRSSENGARRWDKQQLNAPQLEAQQLTPGATQMLDGPPIQWLAVGGGLSLRLYRWSHFH